MQKRLTMKKIVEILRMKWVLNQKHRDIASSLGISASTVSECLRRANHAGLNWAKAKEMTESQLNELLYTVIKNEHADAVASIDWSQVHRSMKRKGVTLKLLWEERQAIYPEIASYSTYCRDYKHWIKASDLSMRQTHKAGEKTFVDYAGMTMVIIDKETGEEKTAQIFVGSLGCSSYLFAEATWTQGLVDWLSSHVRMFEFFGGATEIVVPDNLRTGVNKSHRYDPEINMSYVELAEHYQIAVIPARVRSPKDKSKAEQGVQDVERRILAPLRDRQFFTLEELNSAIKPLLEKLNKRAFQKRPGSRLSEFEAIDKPALRPLPAQRYELGFWLKASVGKDYHICVKEHYYSVPHQLSRKKVYVRYTQTTVEIFHDNRRVASHRLSDKKHENTTLKSHMPKGHRAYADSTPAECYRISKEMGPETEVMVKAFFARAKHPLEAVKWSEGLWSLGRRYGGSRLERACARANRVKSVDYKSIQCILEKNLDTLPENEGKSSHEEQENKTQRHSNIRGKEYYH